jgi:hypothetical protein
MAIPLTAVERIERVPLSAIEYAGGAAVVQFGGEWLRLEDEYQVLAELEATAGAMATLLVCRRPGPHAAQRVAIVVGRVLDVLPGTLLAADTAMCGGRLAMVKDRLVTLRDGFAGPAAALQEVA